MVTDLKDKVIVVTGASSGLSKVLATRLAMEKTRLVLLSRSAEKLQDISSQIQNNNGNVSCFSCDVTDRFQIEHAIEYIIEAYGTVDILINTAAVLQKGPIDSITPDKIRELFDVNTIGVITMTRAVLPAMKQNHTGHIVNIVSTAAVESEANLAVYTSTKYAVRGFTESIEKELAPFGIRVTGIYPGAVDPDLYDTMPLTDQKTQVLEDADRVAEIILCTLKQPNDFTVDHVEMRGFRVNR
jgi:NADP-dependent 3-hydroxy acid dehydrogenase YdfG